MTNQIDWIGVRSAFEAGLSEIYADHARLWDAATERGLLPEMTFARMLAGKAHELLKEHISEGRVADLLLSRLVNYEQFREVYRKKSKIGGIGDGSVGSYVAWMLVDDVLRHCFEEQHIA